MKKRIAIALLLLSSCVLFFFAAPPPDPEDEALIDSYEQHPPIVKNYWVQKLQTPLQDGSNMIIKIEFEDGIEIPETLDIYYGQEEGESPLYITFHDDGAAPDATADDRIYSAYVQEDITEFVDQITAMQATLETKGSFLHFKGHMGQLINEIPEFDLVDFNNFDPVSLNPFLFDAIDCPNELKKQNSLFITDLSVVEDGARTYNVADGTGDPEGVWTFGNLIKNMANYNVTGVTAKELLKEWLKGWTDGRTVNGQNVPARTDVFRFLIGPWLEKANPAAVGTNYHTGTLANSDWEDYWDATSEADLLKYAPFKLTAIVNRIDLRGSFAFRGQLKNAGETRFIFTLIAPIQIGNTPAGSPPVGFDGAGFPNGTCAENLIDWEGMNVIFEYGNPHTSLCDLRNYAMAWYNLSAYTLGSSQYNEALQEITETVINANAVPDKPNGSALNQLRTNERIFFPSSCGIQGTSAWQDSDWELSQFELNDDTHLLEPAPVTNTPRNQSNIPFYVDMNPNNGGGTDPNPFSTHSGHLALLEYMFKYRIRVENGNHNIPSSFMYGSDEMKLAATALVDAEQVHYWDVNWEESTESYTAMTWGTTDVAAKNLRHQISLNTCQGCHTGETKTMFTQVSVLPYFESANYWGTIPEYDDKFMDNRFAEVTNTTHVNNVVENRYKEIGQQTTPRNYFQRVSAFLTGRKYSYDPATGNGTFQDDNYQANEDNSDHTLDGLYYVYEATNSHNGNSDGTMPNPERLVGFNDLEMRKQQLCRFINSPCAPPDKIKVIEVAKEVLRVPLPAKSH